MGEVLRNDKWSEVVLVIELTTLTGRDPRGMLTRNFDKMSKGHYPSRDRNQRGQRIAHLNKGQ